MSHDDGKKTDDINQADIILLGVSRTSKTPTSIYLSQPRLQNFKYTTCTRPKRVPNVLEKIFLNIVLLD